MNTYKITALAENTAFRHNCLAQHGQSMLIEVENYKMLFDVWEVPWAVLYNMEQLWISIDEIDDIIISHQHIDHIWALLSMMPKLKKQRIFLPEQLWIPHIKEHPNKYNFLKTNSDGKYDLSISKDDVLEIKKYKNINIVRDEGFEISHKIYTTWCIGEKMKEQAIVINQKELWITVVVWCSHPTVELLVDRAKEITGNKKVRWIIWGMHYTDYTEEEMNKKAKILNKSEIEFIAPGHCTTVKWCQILKNVLWDKVIISKTGTFGVWNSVILWEKIGNQFV